MSGLAVTGGVGHFERPDPTPATIWAQLRIGQVAQTLHGATSLKPTDLLILNVSMLEKCTKAWTLTSSAPSGASIGQTEAGQYRAAPFKEYPPSFRGSLAQSPLMAIEACYFDDHVQDPPDDFLAACAHMYASEFGPRIGPDYARR